MKTGYLHNLCTMKDVECPVMGIDFDGTIAEQIPWQGPGNFGPPVKHVAAALTYFQSLGYEIAIYTSRGPESYPFIVEYCNKYKIPFDYINENPHAAHFTDTNAVKPVYDVYIDDKNIRFDGIWKPIVENIRDLAFPYWMKRK